VTKESASRPASPLAARRTSSGRQEADSSRRRASGSSQCHLAPAALEQGRTQRFLEGGNGLRQRRLGHVQALGGAAEMQLFGDGDEIAQLAEVDIHRYAFPLIFTRLICCAYHSPANLIFDAASQARHS
jgi:hypothetical protein